MINASEQALIALGGNQPCVWGDPTSTIQKAIDTVAKETRAVAKYSGFFRTAAVPAGSGPDFINAAMRIETDLPPDALLDLLHRIEAMAGRTRQRRWGQRTLDLDLLAYGQTVSPDVKGFRAWADLAPDAQAQIAPDRLILPHPRMHERAFVLVPLAEVAPDWRHPVFGQTVAEMCAALPNALFKDVIRLPDQA